MHQDVRNIELRRDVPDHGVESSRADVVDDVGSRLKRLPRDLPLHGVDGDDGVRPGRADQFDDRNHAPDLLLRVDAEGARAVAPPRRARRLAADVDDIGPFLQKPQRVGGRGLRVGMESPVGKAVGGDVDDPHQDRSQECVGAGAARREEERNRWPHT